MTQTTSLYLLQRKETKTNRRIKASSSMTSCNAKKLKPGCPEITSEALGPLQRKETKTIYPIIRKARRPELQRKETKTGRLLWCPAV